MAHEYDSISDEVIWTNHYKRTSRPKEGN
ncbi:hypothetical protein [Galbibacter sp. BG1]